MFYYLFHVRDSFHEEMYFLSLDVCHSYVSIIAAESLVVFAYPFGNNLFLDFENEVANPHLCFQSVSLQSKRLVVENLKQFCLATKPCIVFLIYTVERKWRKRNNNIQEYYYFVLIWLRVRGLAHIVIFCMHAVEAKHRGRLTRCTRALRWCDERGPQRREKPKNPDALGNFVAP